MNFEDYGRIMDLKNNNIWKKRKWTNDENHKDISGNIHWGQLKLFYTELEFLIIALEHGYDLSESVIIYIGAAPGTHINYLTKLFPNIKWILIDPNKFHIRTSNNVDIITGKNGFFKDDMISSLMKHKFIKDSKYRLFISDIRTSTEEETIFNEMLSQQRWLLKIGADLSMLKFRLPYTFENKKDTWTYDLGDIKSYIKQPNGRPICLNIKNNLCYLQGDIYLQIFPPQYSTETRLIIDKKNNYKMRNYNTIDYEEKCYYYNTNIRNSHVIYKDVSELSKHIIGFKPTYEYSSIYYIIYSYCKLMKVPINNIINIIYDIHEFHNNIVVNINGNKIYKSLGVCSMLTIYEKFPSLEYKISRLLPDKQKELIDSIYKVYIDSISYNKEQIKLLKNESKLTKEQYDKQIVQLYNSIKYNKIIYDYLLKLDK